MAVFAETELLDACRVLFSAEVQINRAFLHYIQPGGVKSAYRQKAKETHPDRFVGADSQQHEQQTELFRHVSQAYQLLDSFSNADQRIIHAPADWRTSYASKSTSTDNCRNGSQYANSNPYGSADASSNCGDSPYELPKRHLETGLYLYYRGVITYAEMIEALVWQRRQRPILGSIAESWGWLKTADVQRINRFHGKRGRFGARAVNLGYLTPFQVQVLLRHQRHAQQLFGQYFVESGRLSLGEIEAYVREQQRHNSRYRSPAK